MRPRSTLVLAWLLTGFSAVVGSVLGNAFGQRGLFVGALIGGAAGVVASVAIAARRNWIASSERFGAMVGGLAGFAIAAPIAALNLDTPVAPVASCALVGVGVLFGAGVARGAR
jgi:hypothetical protein